MQTASNQEKLRHTLARQRARVKARLTANWLRVQALAEPIEAATAPGALITGSARNSTICDGTRPTWRNSVPHSTCRSLNSRASTTVAARFGTNTHHYFDVPGLGRRFIDDLGVDKVARESKVGKANLTSSIKLQIQKDVALRQAGDVAGVEWYFFDSEVSGPGGPSANLKAYLDAKNIPVYYNGVLQPVGLFVK